jgi:4-hydroxybenzoate polyprenyltransferase
MYCILNPILLRAHHAAMLDFGMFSLLVLSTLLIAAAGYVINDYFDVKTDLVNRPSRVVIGKQLSRRQAIALHAVMNGIGIVIGFFLAMQVGRWWLVGMHVLTASLLWFYSTYFKRRMLSGNVIVSLLTAIVPVVVLLYQSPDLDARWFDAMLFYTLLYALFAFLVSMMREIVKDMQDMQGDVSIHCRTLPIVAGLRTSKVVVNVFAIGVLLLLAAMQALLLPEKGMLLVIYVLLFVQLPIVFVLAKLRPADRPADFRILSYFIKGIMLTGILTMPLIPWIMHPMRLYRSLPFDLW